MENLQEKMNRAWEYLHTHGIQTEEELDKALKNMKLDIGIFVSTLNNKEDKTA